MHHNFNIPPRLQASEYDFVFINQSEKSSATPSTLAKTRLRDEFYRSEGFNIELALRRIKTDNFNNPEFDRFTLVLLNQMGRELLLSAAEHFSTSLQTEHSIVGIMVPIKLHQMYPGIVWTARDSHGRSISIPAPDDAECTTYCLQIVDSIFDDGIGIGAMR